MTTQTVEPSQFSNATGVMRALKRASRHLVPPAPLKPSAWAEQNVRIPAGNAIPGPIRFDNAPYQREPMDMATRPGCYRISLMWGAQVGKALSVETPIPTPTGFKKMLDIQKGDLVLDESGSPCCVTLATHVMHNRQCYRVMFDDGTDVVCDAEHLWTVVDRGHKIRGRLTHREITLPLHEMIDSHKRSQAAGRTRYAIRNCLPAQHERRDLPIDPYLYGLWLGDGAVFDGQIILHRSDTQLIGVIESRGHSCFVRYRDKRSPDVAACRIICADGEPLSKKLRVSGLRTKGAVSSDYLMSSVEDRRDLLAGLMDTDGHIAKNGTAEFINKSQALSRAVAQLAASLGMKPRSSKVTKSCRYKGVKQTGEYWKVSFRAYAEDRVFILARKKEAVQVAGEGKKYLRRTESRQRGIVGIEPVASVPVKCIQVDSPSRLYLCTDQYVPTHNTQLALCLQGYAIAHEPRSQMMMQPSQGDLTTWLETKFNPMVDANPSLQRLLAKPRSHEGVNNQRMKSYPGGFLMFAWAGSTKTMRGRSAPWIVADEIDGYSGTDEGDEVQLIWQRAATFGDQRLLLEISTPTIKGASRIESSFEQGDQRHYHVACPHCDHHQILAWDNVVWDKDDDGTHHPDTAAYACRHCGALWSDGERIVAIRTAEQVGAGWKSARPFRGHASYHLNELYSCFRRLRDIVQSFLDKKASNDLQSFVNVSLAQTWEEQGEKADAHALMGRAEQYRAPVPAGGFVLTAGVDMQQDRLEVETVAWGQGEESWSIDYAVLWGDTLQDDVWRDLDDHLAATWTHESGAQLGIVAACLDTGGTAGYTQRAYEYARGKTGRRLFAVKGIPGWDRPVVMAPSRRKTGKGQRKVDLFSVGVDEAKLTVMRRLAVEAPGPGYTHVPADREPEWFHQLTAEKLLTKYLKGAPRREWHQTRTRNEALDCRVYAYAALKIANPNLKRHARRLTEQSAEVEEAPAPSGVEHEAEKQAPVIHERPKEPEQSRPRKKRRSARRNRSRSWVNGW